MAVSASDLQTIAANVSKGMEAAKSSLEDFAKAKMTALKAGDSTAYKQIQKLETATKNLIAAEEERNKINQESSELRKEIAKLDEERAAKVQQFTKLGSKTSKEALKLKQDIARKEADILAKKGEYETKYLVLSEKALKSYQKNKRIINAGLEAEARAMEAKAKATAEYAAKQKEAFDNSRTGKVFNAMTGQVAGLAAKLSFAGLAYKAYARYEEASQTRTEIMIKSFQGLNDATEDSIQSTTELSSAQKGFWSTTAQMASGLVKAAPKAYSFSKALQEVKVSAAIMGVDTAEASRVMIEFARIAGTKNPEALSRLSRGAIVVSKAMGIDTAEAVDFVNQRMNKFGGTAESSILALNAMRTETEKTNQAFGRTVLRGDDIVKVLGDISKRTDVYAIDQRLVSQVLRDTTTRLQSMGDSYDSAKDKAEVYTKAVTGEAPEWMKILSGQNIAKEMSDAMSKDDSGATFMDKFGRDLDKAKPGLSAKIKEILNDSTRDQFSKQQLIQELTAQTSVGIGSMNKQIVNLSNTLGGQASYVVAKMFNTTQIQADEMIKSAKVYEKRVTEIANQQSMSAEALAKEYGISVKQAEQLKSKKGLLESMYDVKKAKELTDLDQKRIKDAIKSASDEQVRLDGELKADKKLYEIEKNKLSLMEKDSKADPKAIESQQALVDSLNANIKKKQEDYVQQQTTVFEQRRSAIATQLEALDKELKRTDVSKEYKDRKAKEKQSKIQERDELDKKTKQEGLDVEAAIGKIEKAMSENATPETFFKFVTEKLSGLGTIITALGGLGAMALIQIGTNSRLTIANKALKAIEGALIARQGKFGSNGGSSGSGGSGSGESNGGSNGSNDGGGKEDSTKNGKESGGKQSMWSKMKEKFSRKGKAADAVTGKSKRFGGRWGKIAGAAIGLGAVGAAMMYSGTAKGSDETPPEEETKAKEINAVAEEKTKEEESGLKKAVSGALAVGSVATSAGGLLSLAATGGGKVAKVLKAAPVLGTVVGAGFALQKAWEIYKKWKAGEEISPSDKVKMATELGSMIPFIGTAIALGDAAAEGTGLYEQMDAKLGQPVSKSSTLASVPDKLSLGVPSSPSAPSAPYGQAHAAGWTNGTSDDAKKALSLNSPNATNALQGQPNMQPNMQPNTQTPQQASTFGQVGTELQGSFGQLMGDGSISLKIPNFMNAFAGGMKLANQGMKPT